MHQNFSKGSGEVLWVAQLEQNFIMLLLSIQETSLNGENIKLISFQNSLKISAEQGLMQT